VAHLPLDTCLPCLLTMSFLPFPSLALPYAELSQIPTVLFGTINGVIGVVASLPHAQYQLLEGMQEAMRKVVKGVGGFDHAQVGPPRRQPVGRHPLFASSLSSYSAAVWLDAAAFSPCLLRLCFPTVVSCLPCGAGPECLVPGCWLRLWGAPGPYTVSADRLTHTCVLVLCEPSPCCCSGGRSATSTSPPPLPPGLLMET
jgi:hypothetical protein